MQSATTGNARETAVLRLVNCLGALGGIGSVMYRSMNGRLRPVDERELVEGALGSWDEERRSVA